MANIEMITSLANAVVVGARVVNEHDDAGDQEAEAQGRCVAIAASFEALGRELAPLLERAIVVPVEPVEAEPPYTAPEDGDPASDGDETHVGVAEEVPSDGDPAADDGATND